MTFQDTESGGISSLVEKLQAKQPSNYVLETSNITDQDLDVLFPEHYGIYPDKNDKSYLGKILYVIGLMNLVETSYVPKFLLGSTRLAALKKYGKQSIWTDKLETDEIIQIASNKKNEFGDLDVDLVFKVNKKQIADAIEKIDPVTYAAKVSNEINVAIRIGNKVVQIDLVDVKDNENSTEFLQKSSFLDLANNIKGLFSILLLRATISHMKIEPQEALETILEFAENNPNSIFAKELMNKQQDGFTPFKVRFSLANEGLKLILDLKKLNIKGKTIEDKINIDLDPRADFKNLDKLAQVILQDLNTSSADIFHAIRLSQFLRKNRPDIIPQVWETFKDLAYKRAQSGLTEEEFRIGLNEIGKILGVNQTHSNILNEGKQSIGRFSGVNEFNNITLFELLKSIVKTTQSQGKETINLNLSEPSSNIDLIEKVDRFIFVFWNR